MNKKKIGFSIGGLQKLYGDKRALEIAAEIGADCVDFATETFGDAVCYNAVDFFGDIHEFLMNYNRIKAASEHRDFYTTCVDTGHSNKAMRYGNPKPGDVIRMIGSDISVLHLHDNDTFTDQHKIPMTGCIDWNDVLSALDEVGYSGVYNLELNLGNFGKGMEIEMAAFGLKVLRHMLDGR